MKNEPIRPTNTRPASLVGLRPYTLTLLACLFALLTACTANRTEPNKGQKLQLTVGDIKELTMDTRTDTTWQLVATSDNQEVVDVSRKPTAGTTGTGTDPIATGPAVFLIKGVTVGTARVVFAEKQMGTDGTGRVKKAYNVTVTTK
jgi:hypothetical protein